MLNRKVLSSVSLSYLRIAIFVQGLFRRTFFVLFSGIGYLNIARNTVRIMRADDRWLVVAFELLHVRLIFYVSTLPLQRVRDPLFCLCKLQRHAAPWAHQHQQSSNRRRVSPADLPAFEIVTNQSFYDDTAKTFNMKKSELVISLFVSAAL